MTIELCKISLDFYHEGGEKSLMFLEKYISEFYFKQILENYEEEYLNNLDENNFLEIIRLFQKYEFYFIEDIILNYLQIFELPASIVAQKLEMLKHNLGDNFVYIIGKDMTYLSQILIDIDDP